MNFATLFKIAKFLFANWGVMKGLLDQIMKLFKGESTKEAVQECLNGVCEIADKKKNEQPKKRRGGWFGRR